MLDFVRRSKIRICMYMERIIYWLILRVDFFFSSIAAAARKLLFFSLSDMLILERSNFIEVRMIDYIL